MYSNNTITLLIKIGKGNLCNAKLEPRYTRGVIFSEIMSFLKKVSLPEKGILPIKFTKFLPTPLACKSRKNNWLFLFIVKFCKLIFYNNL